MVGASRRGPGEVHERTRDQKDVIGLTEYQEVSAWSWLCNNQTKNGLDDRSRVKVAFDPLRENVWPVIFAKESNIPIRVEQMQ
jgi:hypothetical protein